MADPVLDQFDKQFGAAPAAAPAPMSVLPTLTDPNEQKRLREIVSQPGFFNQAPDQRRSQLRSIASYSQAPDPLIDKFVETGRSVMDKKPGLLRTIWEDVNSPVKALTGKSLKERWEDTAKDYATGSAGKVMEDAAKADLAIKNAGFGGDEAATSAIQANATPEGRRFTHALAGEAIGLAESPLTYVGLGESAVNGPGAARVVGKIGELGNLGKEALSATAPKVAEVLGQAGPAAAKVLTGVQAAQLWGTRAFQTQALAGAATSVHDYIKDPTPENAAKALVGAGLGVAVGKHLVEKTKANYDAGGEAVRIMERARDLAWHDGKIQLQTLPMEAQAEYIRQAGQDVFAEVPGTEAKTIPGKFKAAKDKAWRLKQKPADTAPPSTMPPAAQAGNNPATTPEWAAKNYQSVPGQEVIPAERGGALEPQYAVTPQGTAVQPASNFEANPNPNGFTRPGEGVPPTQRPPLLAGNIPTDVYQQPQGDYQDPRALAAGQPGGQVPAVRGPMDVQPQYTANAPVTDLQPASNFEANPEQFTRPGQTSGSGPIYQGQPQLPGAVNPPAFSMPDRGAQGPIQAQGGAVPPTPRPPAMATPAPPSVVARKATESQQAPMDLAPSTPPQAQLPMNPPPVLPGGGHQIVLGAPTRFLAIGQNDSYKVNGHFAVVPREAINVSHDTSFNPRSEFPAEIQPRKRGRKAGIARVNEIANKLDLDQASHHPEAGGGAPIMNPNDFALEGGNGRVIAINLAYERGSDKAKQYRQDLIDRAVEFGVDPKYVASIKDPVLVRVRTGELPPGISRQQFARDTNKDNKQGMSPLENAAVDREALTPDVMALYDPDAEINAPANAEFVKQFIGGAVGPQEKDQIQTAGGGLNGNGVRRIEAAIFARAYGDSPLLDSMSESTDPEVKNVIKALISVSPQMINLDDAIAAGVRHPLSISEDVAWAGNKLAQLKRTGTKLQDYFRQGDFVNDPPTPIQTDLFQVMDEFNRSGRKIGDVLQKYIAGANAAGNPLQEDMFGSGVVPTQAEVLQGAINAVKAEAEAQKKPKEGAKDNAVKVQQDAAGSGAADNGAAGAAADLGAAAAKAIQSASEQPASKQVEQPKADSAPKADETPAEKPKRLSLVERMAKIINDAESPKDKPLLARAGENLADHQVLINAVGPLVPGVNPLKLIEYAQAFHESLVEDLEEGGGKDWPEEDIEDLREIYPDLAAKYFGEGNEKTSPEKAVSAEANKPAASGEPNAPAVEPASGAVGSDNGRAAEYDGLGSDNLRDAAGDGQVGDQSNGETPRPVDFENKRIVSAGERMIPPSDTSVIPPEIAQYLKPQQLTGAADAISAMNGPETGFLIADGTGAGKSLMSLTVAKHFADKGYSVLIVSKAEAFKFDYDTRQPTGTYARWSKTFGVPLEGYVGPERDKFVTKLEPGKVYAATYDTVFGLAPRENPKKPGKFSAGSPGIAHLVGPNTVLIMDEAHAAKNSGGGAENRANASVDMATRAGKVLMMTATPGDKPAHVQYLQRVGLLEGKSQDQQLTELGFKKKVTKGKDGKDVVTWNIDNLVGKIAVRKRLDALFSRLMANGQMVKREISMDGVDIQMTPIELPEDGYDVMDMIESRLSDGAGLKGVSGLQKAVILGHMRRAQETYKIPHIVNMVKEELAEGRKVIIFIDLVNDSPVIKRTKVMTPHGPETLEETIHVNKATAGALKQALFDIGLTAEDIAEIHGNSKENSIEAMKRFQDGDAKVVIATGPSGGTGIDLDDQRGNAPRTMIVATAPFEGTANTQMIGRAWRLGTKSSPRVRYVFANTETDHWNMKILADKMKTLGVIVKGEAKGAMDFENIKGNKAIRQGFVPEGEFVEDDDAADAPAGGEAKVIKGKGGKVLPPPVEGGWLKLQKANTYNNREKLGKKGLGGEFDRYHGVWQIPDTQANREALMHIKGIKIDGPSDYQPKVQETPESRAENERIRRERAAELAKIDAELAGKVNVNPAAPRPVFGSTPPPPRLNTRDALLSFRERRAALARGIENFVNDNELLRNLQDPYLSRGKRDAASDAVVEAQAIKDAIGRGAAANEIQLRREALKEHVLKNFADEFEWLGVSREAPPEPTPPPPSTSRDIAQAFVNGGRSAVLPKQGEPQVPYKPKFGGAKNTQDRQLATPRPPMFSDPEDKPPLAREKTPQEKTVENFQKMKADESRARSDWGEHVELVPTSELLPYREYNRARTEKYGGHYAEVRDAIAKNGITEPVIISYNPTTGTAYMSEGNTRLSAAKDLGITSVPARGYRWSLKSQTNADRPVPSAYNKGRVPADIPPSDLGFTSETEDKPPLARTKIPPVGDPEDTPQFAREPGPVWYSQLQKTIESKMPMKASADQVRGIFRNPQNGVKADEVKWTGLDDWLGQQHGTITKEQVVDYLKQNNVQVKEVSLGGNSREQRKIQDQIDELSRQYDATDEWAEREAIWEKRRALQEEYNLKAAPTKYSEYRTPGGSDYGELLMTVPVTGKDFVSSHWGGQENVVAHLRYENRIGPDKQKHFLIVENQSDWGQAGRDRGFQPSGAEREAIEDSLRESSEALKKKTDEFVQARDTAIFASSDAARARLAQLSKEKAILTAAVEATKQTLNAGVPAMPFAKTWHEMVMRRALRHAVEGGFDRLSWEQGDVHSDRYALSRQVSKVEWAPFSPGTKGQLVAYGNSRGIVFSSMMEPGDIADYIGKDAAKKLLDPASKDGEHHLISGEDLRVGKQGMREFYDEILPRYGNKLAGKFGSKVEKAEIKLPETAPQYKGKQYTLAELKGLFKAARADEDDPFREELGRLEYAMTEGDGNSFADSIGDVLGSLSRNERARFVKFLGGELATQPTTATVWSIPITEEMRDSVMQGQPLFQRTKTPPSIGLFEAQDDTDLAKQDKDRLLGQRLTAQFNSQISAQENQAKLKKKPELQESFFEPLPDNPQSTLFLRGMNKPVKVDANGKPDTVAAVADATLRTYAAGGGNRAARVYMNPAAHQIIMNAASAVGLINRGTGWFGAAMKPEWIAQVADALRPDGEIGSRVSDPRQLEKLGQMADQLEDAVAQSKNPQAISLISAGEAMKNVKAIVLHEQAHADQFAVEPKSNFKPTELFGAQKLPKIESGKSYQKAGESLMRLGYSYRQLPTEIMAHVADGRLDESGNVQNLGVNPVEGLNLYLDLLDAAVATKGKIAYTLVQNATRSTKSSIRELRRSRRAGSVQRPNTGGTEHGADQQGVSGGRPGRGDGRRPEDFQGTARTKRPPI